MACLLNLQRCNARHEAERNGVSTEHDWRYSGISHRYAYILRTSPLNIIYAHHSLTSLIFYSV